MRADCVTDLLVLDKHLQKPIAFMNRIYGVYGEAPLVISMDTYYVLLRRNIGTVFGPILGLDIKPYWESICVEYLCGYIQRVNKECKDE